MTAQVRPAFELLRFTAAPVGDALALVDVEGRFGTSAGRFARRPALVVEPADGGRLEVGPVHVDTDGDRWRAAYALPAAALVDGRFALALRGALVELPAPDMVDATSAARPDHTVQLAREANALRRRLERAEAQAAQAEDHAEAAEERATMAEAGAAAAAERIAVLERAVRELEQRILVAEGDADDAERRAEVLEQRVTDAEARAAEAEGRVESADRRAADADERAAAADRRAAAGEEGLQVLRAELAEERERRPRVADEDLYEDDDDERDRTPPGGIVRTRVGPVAQPRPVTLTPVRPRVTHRLERWLAVVALLLAVAVVVALAFGIRA